VLQFALIWCGALLVPILGLIEAVDRFDQTRGLKFRTYAQHRIRGAMQDFLRDEDPLSRTERRRVRAAAPLRGDPCRRLESR